MGKYSWETDRGENTTTSSEMYTTRVLYFMLAEHLECADGVAMLAIKASSPLRKEVYVQIVVKVMGLVSFNSRHVRCF